MEFRIFTLHPKRRLGLIFIGALLVILSMAGLLLPTSIGAQSDEQMIAFGSRTYTLEHPIIISAAPLIRLETAIVKFTAPDTTAPPSPTVLRQLPSNWAALSLKGGVREAVLSQAEITLDLRKVKKSQSPLILLQKALTGLKFSSIEIKNSQIKVLRDMGPPLQFPLKQALFELDIDDGEFEGKGKIQLGEWVTDFALSAAYPPLEKGSDQLTELELGLKNTAFEGEYKGTISGTKGLLLDGGLKLLLKDMAALSPWIDEQPPRSEGVTTKQKTRRTLNQRQNFFSADGKLAWQGDSGTLSKASLKFGENLATGALRLTLTENNHVVSGSVAFQGLDFSSLLTPETTEDASLPQQAFVRFRDQLELVGKWASPFIRNVDADLRISAQEMKVAGMTFNDAGFSLYQKNGAVIFDIAETDFFNGRTSGHIKIDTNFPKPRWHINTRLLNIDLSSLTEAFSLPAFIEGQGTIKLHLTSFGDKSSEIYQNMYGSLSLDMPQGGMVGFNLSPLLFVETASLDNNTRSELNGAEFSGKTAVSKVEGVGHFAKGAIVTDYLALTTDKNMFTSTGSFNFQSGAYRWHIASWPLKDPTHDDNQSQSLLVCSEISGLFHAFRLEKKSGAQLSSAQKACPAPYRPNKLKSHQDTIVR